MDDWQRPRPSGNTSGSCLNGSSSPNKFHNASVYQANLRLLPLRNQRKPSSLQTVHIQRELRTRTQHSAAQPTYSQQQDYKRELQKHKNRHIKNCVKVINYELF